MRNVQTKTVDRLKNALVGTAFAAVGLGAIGVGTTSYRSTERAIQELRPRAAAAFERFKGSAESICREGESPDIVITRKDGARVRPDGLLSPRITVNGVLFRVELNVPEFAGSNRVTFTAETKAGGLVASREAFKTTLDVPLCK
jgi:hypothetical protein